MCIQGETWNIWTSEFRSFIISFTNFINVHPIQLSHQSINEKMKCNFKHTSAVI